MSKLLKLFHRVNRLSSVGLSNSFLGDLTFGDDFYSKPTERQKNIEYIRSVASIENKSRELLKNLIRSKSVRVSLIHLERLVAYLKKHHLARERINKDNGIIHILNLFQSCRDTEVRKQAKIALSLLGYVDPVKGRGIRILALDGGGTRLVNTIILLFDLFCLFIQLSK